MEKLTFYNKGNYISQAMRLGKAVQIQKFGTFTFTAPSVNLEVTRSQKPKDPK